LYYQASISHKEIIKVRIYIKRITGFEDVIPIINDINLGSFATSSYAIDTLFDSQKKIIVLEDDVMVSNNYLKKKKLKIRIVKDSI